jgi:asparagine synthase (glutamine-hydrolysing)
MAQTSITGGVSTQNIIPKDRFVSRLKQLLLSTIGLSDRRTQRMQRVDGSVVIFNGEIYNYKALRSKLEADLEKGRLVLGRDLCGIKPLYYSDDGKTLRFASQVKALLAGNVSRTRSRRGWR